MPADPDYVASKLKAQVDGDLAGDSRLRTHLGLVDDVDHRDALSWLEASYDVTEFDDDDMPLRFADTRIGRQLGGRWATHAGTEALTGDGQNKTMLAYLSGLSDDEVSGSALSTVSKLQGWLDNNNSPCVWLSCGLPNTGKTNFVGSKILIWRSMNPNGEVVSNVRSLRLGDHYVSSMSEAYDVLTDLDGPGLWILDEASTWCNNKQFGREISQQLDPVLKRLAKMGDGVDMIPVGHTGIDLSAELRRHATTVSLKVDKKTAEIYGGLDDDRYIDPRCTIENLENVENVVDGDPYDPDDWSPWSWDLDPDRVRDEDAAR